MIDMSKLNKKQKKNVKKAIFNWKQKIKNVVIPENKIMTK